MIVGLTVYLLSSAILLVSSPDDTAFEPNPEVDAIFAQWDRLDSPGCAVSVIDDGEVIYARGYGSAQLEYQVPITPNTVFHVASVSKQFAAFALALLETQGKLDLDDDVRKYIPEVPDFGATITLRHLLNHTSGLRDQWSLLSLAGWADDDVITHQDVMRVVASQRELNFPPGDRELYSNTGYTLVAEVVRRVTGRTLRQFAESEMFEPLEMTRTHFHDDHTEVVPGRAYSFQPTADGGWDHGVLSFSVVGATSLFTTVMDLARWQENLDYGDVGGMETVEKMFVRGVLNDGTALDYALGIVHGTYRGVRTTSHSGGDAGFRSYLVRFPEQQLSVAVLANAPLNTRTLAMRVADLYLSDEFEDPSNSRSILEMANALPPPDTTAPTAPATIDLKDWIGAYYSPELDITYRLLETPEGIVLRRRHLDDEVLNAPGSTLLGDGSGMKFVPGGEDASDQILVSTGRVLNLRFYRVPEPREQVAAHPPSVPG